MAGFIALLTYLFAGLLCARAALPDKSPLIRLWIGLSFGVLLMMWLPALAAFLIRFTLTAQYAALGVLAIIALGAALWQRKHARAPKPLDASDRVMVIALCAVALPLTVLSGYLQHTHTLREVDGALHVGQSTYGDMCMHLSIVMSLRDAALPIDYNILPGNVLGYPILTDALTTSLYMLGMPLRLAFIVPGTLMSGLVFAGFMLLAKEMTGKTSAAVIASLLLFLNGGLGFLYDFDLSGTDFSKITEIFTGYYATPANQPEFNLRWSNLVADLLLPQRTFLGGWTVLLPALYFVREAFQKAEKRMFLLAALFGGLMPLVHTHSFLALGLYSAATLLYSLCTQKENRRGLIVGASLYLGIVLAVALPQLLAFTLPQATGEGFLRLHFNWVNSNASGLIDFYPWFWLKNVGLPLIVMLCALLDFKKHDRMDMLGAALIFIVAELVLFQPLEYDNNKLFYVWYLLMLPAAASWCVSLWHRMSGRRSRVLLASLFIIASTLSGSLSIAREVISDYQLFSESEVKLAAYIDENTERDDMFLTGLHHNNPVYTLAGRSVVCGPANFLWTHGLDYHTQEADVRAFYTDPANNLDILAKYGVDYIVVGWPERSNLKANESAISRLFPVAHEEDGIRIYKVD